MVTWCLTIWGTAKMFSTASAAFYISTSNAWGLQFLHILATIYFVNKNFFIIAIIVGVKWYLTVGLVCSSLIDKWYSVPFFHVLISHLCLSFENREIESREVSISFLNWAVCFCYYPLGFWWYCIKSEYHWVELKY